MRRDFSHPAASPTTSSLGVTLLELIFAMALGGVVILGLGYVYAGAWASWRGAEDKLRLHRALDMGLATVTREVRQAKQVQPLASGLNLIFDDTLPEPRVHFEVSDGQVLRNGTVVEILADTGLRWLRLSGEGLKDASGLNYLRLELQAATRAETLDAQTELRSRNGAVLLSGAKP